MKYDKYLLRRPINKLFLYYGGECGTFPSWVTEPEQAKFLSKKEAEEVGMMVLETQNIACDIIGPYI